MKMSREENRNDAVNKLRAAGLFTKGVVYGLVGILAAMFALGMGGDIKSVSDLVGFLQKQTFGTILLALVAIGLAAYSLWRLYETFSNSDAIFQEDKSSTGKRLYYFYSFAIYAILTYTFAKPLLGGGSGGGSDSTSKEGLLSRMLDKDWGVYAIGLIALIVLGQGVYQFYRAYSGKFMKKLDEQPGKHYHNIKRAGKIGYMARGIVFSIIAFFLYRVIQQHSADAFRGTEGGMEYLLTLDYGNWVLAAVAIGLLGYGIFNVMAARYAKFSTIG